MNKFERPYSFDKAVEEADKLKAKVSSGEAEGYNEAEKIVEKEERLKEKRENRHERNKTASKLILLRKTMRHSGGFEGLGKRDVKGFQYSLGRSNLEYLEALHGRNFVKEIKNKWGKDKREKEPVLLLDIGAASSTTLAELKKALGKRVECHSVDIHRTPSQKGVIQHIWHAEGLSRHFPLNTFDLVIDNRGGVFHSRNRKKALEEVIAVLAPGGNAYFHPRPDVSGFPFARFFEKHWLDEFAKQHGVLVETTRDISKTLNRSVPSVMNPVKIHKPKPDVEESNKSSNRRI